VDFSCGSPTFWTFNQYFTPVSGEYFLIHLKINALVFIAWNWYVDILACLALIIVVLIHEYHAMRVNIWCCTRYLPDPRHVILDTWHLTLNLDLLYLTYDLWHQHTVFILVLGMLHLIYDLWYWHSVFTPALGMLHLIYDIWHWYFPCYIWHMISDTGICHIWHRHLQWYIWHRYLPCYIWHRYLPCYIWHMIPDIGSCHVIFDTWYMTPVFDMLYLPYDI